ncbi:MAG: hypothetical protein KF685_13695 [Acidobacteria bacterium]|nr:hypothetical protein [Acidobacteriota bacterium]
MNNAKIRKVMYFRQKPCLVVILMAFTAFSSVLYAQETVDKVVATVNDGVKTELITLSDLKWQLAMQPGVSITPPGSDDLNRALLLLIDQRLFALEAERLPANPPTEKEVADEIAKLLAYFPSSSEFENRLRIVGFSSVRDDNFEKIIERRVAINKYLDFRFRSFIVVTPEDEELYYQDSFVPDFRAKHPGVLVPTLDEKRNEIRDILTEDRVAAAIETFLDDAKRRAEIVILSEI